jgi:hypothetical protein
MIHYDFTNCADCNQAASGNCGKHGVWTISMMGMLSEQERIGKALALIEEYTKGCHCQTMEYPFCEQFGCGNLREIREILTGEKG